MAPPATGMAATASRKPSARSVPPVSFDEETAQTYEIGFKSEFGASFRLNGAIFTTEYDDMQLTYRLGIVPLLFNAGKSSIDGGELEFTFAPGALILEGSVGYLDNQFDEIAVVPGTTQTVGPNNTLPFAPEWQANLGVGYDFEVGDATLTPHDWGDGSGPWYP